jgi:glycerol-3-phosphate acyltransferase PlsY
LGISTGVMVGVWPTVFPILLAVIILAALITKSSGIASLVTFGTMLILSFVWPAMELEMAWGIAEMALLPLLAGGLVIVLVPKHLSDARRKVKESSHL